jgi:hypothetical protein
MLRQSLGLFRSVSAPGARPVPPLYREAVLAAVPVWYLRLEDEPPTTAIADAVGAYSWTAYNGPTLGVAGAVGRAVEFVIPGQRIEAAAGHFDETQTGDFSLVLWYRSTLPSGTLRYLFSNRLVPGQQGVTLYQSAADELVFSATIGVDSTVINLGSHDTGGAWRMVAVTANRGAGVVVYLDGVAAANDPAFRVSSSLPTASVAAIGARPTTTANGYRGQIDEAAGFGRTLSAREVAALYRLAQ